MRQKGSAVRLSAWNSSNNSRFLLVFLKFYIGEPMQTMLVFLSFFLIMLLAFYIVSLIAKYERNKKQEE